MPAKGYSHLPKREDTMNGESRTTQFQELCFKPKDKYESGVIQQKLFKMGYRWGIESTSQSIQFTEVKYLITTKDGFITWANLYDPENNNFLHHVIVDVKFVPAKNVVEINGKVYLKEELEKVLSTINPIN